MKYPNLLQAQRTRRNNINIWHVIASVIIALVLMMMAASASRAETVEVGIAPGEMVDNPYQTIPISDAEYEELRWVLALEAQGEGLTGEIACCEVIFNRVLSGRWGTGVHGVLSKRGQFSTYKLIGSRKAWAHPGELEDDAISECLRQGLKILPDEKYVYFDTGRKNGRRNVKIGNHWFGAE